MTPAPALTITDDTLTISVGVAVLRVVLTDRHAAFSLSRGDFVRVRFDDLAIVHEFADKLAAMLELKGIGK
jgi:hypothetical protein